MYSLKPEQLDAVHKMKNGCILCGGVGSGKTFTSLSYYYICQGGSESSVVGGDYIPMKHPKDLYIITTAMKRDSLEWEQEMAPFLLSTDPEGNHYKNTVVVDSWNNIGKYKNVTGAFFIFDEQRVVGYGAWSKAFIKISQSNEWVLLSATPGDTWSDYIPVFIANRFFKNKTEFSREHIQYSRFITKYPKIEGYFNEGKLRALRDSILVDIPIKRKTVRHEEYVHVEFDKKLYQTSSKNRWNPFKEEPIEGAGGLCYVQRQIVNTDESRSAAVLEIFERHPRLIIFYNFDYELEILRGLHWGDDVVVAERNGHKHDPLPGVPTGFDRWVYLVQYASGSEAWNCTTSNAIIFYSLNYSYKVMEQARGRIDRTNTPYTDLYYYYLMSYAGIDMAIRKAIREKKNFNESRYFRGGY